MVKQRYNHQWSIEDAQDVADNNEDNHYKDFYNLLFYQSLINIKKIRFDSIIQDHLQSDGTVFKIKEANCLSWLYTANRQLIKSKIVYSFRFPNACDPEYYKTFETRSHHLFLQVPGIRHNCDGWYKYIGKDLPDYIDKYLNIQRVVQNQIPHKTKLFINQKQERLDIQFNFDSINERISICFEPGYPANP